MQNLQVALFIIRKQPGNGAAIYKNAISPVLKKPTRKQRSFDQKGTQRGRRIITENTIKRI